MRPLWQVAVLVLALAGTAAAEGGFNGIVQSLETEFGVQRFQNPVFGFAKFLANVAARPHGVTGMDIALFEDLDVRPTRRSFFEAIRHGAGPEWRPMVRVRSLTSGEDTVVFVRGSGRKVHMVVATCEPGEAVVVNFNLDGRQFAEWLDEPSRMGDRATGSSH